MPVDTVEAPRTGLQGAHKAVAGIVKGAALNSKREPLPERWTNGVNYALALGLDLSERTGLDSHIFTLLRSVFNLNLPLPWTAYLVGESVAFAHGGFQPALTSWDHPLKALHVEIVAALRQIAVDKGGSVGRGLAAERLVQIGDLISGPDGLSGFGIWRQLAITPSMAESYSWGAQSETPESLPVIYENVVDGRRRVDNPLLAAGSEVGLSLSTLKGVWEKVVEQEHPLHLNLPPFPYSTVEMWELAEQNALPVLEATSKAPSRAPSLSKSRQASEEPGTQHRQTNLNENDTVDEAYVSKLGHGRWSPTPTTPILTNSDENAQSDVTNASASAHGRQSSVSRMPHGSSRIRSGSGSGNTRSSPGSPLNKSPTANETKATTDGTGATVPTAGQTHTSLASLAKNRTIGRDVGLPRDAWANSAKFGTDLGLSKEEGTDRILLEVLQGAFKLDLPIPWTVDVSVDGALEFSQPDFVPPCVSKNHPMKAVFAGIVDALRQAQGANGAFLTDVAQQQLSQLVRRTAGSTSILNFGSWRVVSYAQSQTTYEEDISHDRRKDDPKLAAASFVGLALHALSLVWERVLKGNAFPFTHDEMWYIAAQLAEGVLKRPRRRNGGGGRLEHAASPTRGRSIIKEEKAIDAPTSAARSRNADSQQTPAHSGILEDSGEPQPDVESVGGRLLGESRNVNVGAASASSGLSATSARAGEEKETTASRTPSLDSVPDGRTEQPKATTQTTISESATIDDGEDADLIEPPSLRDVLPVDDAEIEVDTHSVFGRTDDKTGDLKNTNFDQQTFAPSGPSTSATSTTANSAPDRSSPRHWNANPAGDVGGTGTPAGVGGSSSSGPAIALNSDSSHPPELSIPSELIDTKVGDPIRLLVENSRLREEMKTMEKTQAELLAATDYAEVAASEGQEALREEYANVYYMEMEMLQGELDACEEEVAEALDAERAELFAQVNAERAEMQVSNEHIQQESLLECSSIAARTAKEIAEYEIQIEILNVELERERAKNVIKDEERSKFQEGQARRIDEVVEEIGCERSQSVINNEEHLKSEAANASRMSKLFEEIGFERIKGESAQEELAKSKATNAVCISNLVEELKDERVQVARKDVERQNCEMEQEIRTSCLVKEIGCIRAEALSRQEEHAKCEEVQSECISNLSMEVALEFEQERSKGARVQEDCMKFEAEWKAEAFLASDESASEAAIAMKCQEYAELISKSEEKLATSCAQCQDLDAESASQNLQIESKSAELTELQTSVNSFAEQGRAMEDNLTRTRKDNFEISEISRELREALAAQGAELARSKVDSEAFASLALAHEEVRQEAKCSNIEHHDKFEKLEAKSQAEVADLDRQWTRWKENQQETWQSERDELCKDIADARLEWSARKEELVEMWQSERECIQRQLEKLSLNASLESQSLSNLTYQHNEVLEEHSQLNKKLHQEIDDERLFSVNRKEAWEIERLDLTEAAHWQDEQLREQACEFSRMEAQFEVQRSQLRAEIKQSQRSMGCKMEEACTNLRDEVLAEQQRSKQAHETWVGEEVRLKAALKQERRQYLEDAEADRSHLQVQVDVRCSELALQIETLENRLAETRAAEQVACLRAEENVSNELENEMVWVAREKYEWEAEKRRNRSETVEREKKIQTCFESKFVQEIAEFSSKENDAKRDAETQRSAMEAVRWADETEIADLNSKLDKKESDLVAADRSGREAVAEAKTRENQLSASEALVEQLKNCISELQHACADQLETHQREKENLGNSMNIKYAHLQSLMQKSRDAQIEAEMKWNVQRNSFSALLKQAQELQARNEAEKDFLETTFTNMKADWAGTVRTLQSEVRSEREKNQEECVTVHRLRAASNSAADYRTELDVERGRNACQKELWTAERARLQTEQNGVEDKLRTELRMSGASFQSELDGMRREFKSSLRQFRTELEVEELQRGMSGKRNEDLVSALFRCAMPSATPVAQSTLSLGGCQPAMSAVPVEQSMFSPGGCQSAMIAQGTALEYARQAGSRGRLQADEGIACFPAAKEPNVDYCTADAAGDHLVASTSSPSLLLYDQGDRLPLGLEAWGVCDVTASSGARCAADPSWDNFSPNSGHLVGPDGHAGPSCLPEQVSFQNSSRCASLVRPRAEEDALGKRRRRVSSQLEALAQFRQPCSAAVGRKRPSSAVCLRTLDLPRRTNY